LSCLLSSRELGIIIPSKFYFAKRYLQLYQIIQVATLTKIKEKDQNNKELEVKKNWDLMLGKISSRYCDFKRAIWHFLLIVKAGYISQVSKVLISKINVSKLIKEIFHFRFIIHQQKLTLSKINVSKLIKKIFDFRFIIYQQN